MLTTIRKAMGFHWQAAMSSLVYLCRQPIATGMTVMVIAITLTLPALLWVLTDNLAMLTKDWKRGGHISLYLEMNTSTDASSQLLANIRKTPGVGEAILKTPGDALLELQHQEGMQELINNLPENPLPSVIDVTPALTIVTPQQLEVVYSQLKSLPGIEDAKLDMQWVSRLYALLDLAEHVTRGLMVLLAAAVVFIIGNTLRLVIYKRHEEIQVLKLIGASNPYIVRPFLYSGLWYGLGSAIIAVLLVYLFMLSLGVVLNQLVAAYHMNLPLLGLSMHQAGWLILVSSALGWFGARVSIKRQLALIEP